MPVVSSCHSVRFLLYPLVVSLSLGTCSFHPSTHLCPSVHSFEHPSILPSIYIHKPISLPSTQTAVLALTHHPLTHLYVRTYARTYPSSSQLSVAREGHGLLYLCLLHFHPQTPRSCLESHPFPVSPPSFSRQRCCSPIRPTASFWPLTPVPLEARAPPHPPGPNPPTPRVSPSAAGLCRLPIPLPGREKPSRLALSTPHCGLSCSPELPGSAGATGKAAGPSSVPSSSHTALQS